MLSLRISRDVLTHVYTCVCVCVAVHFRLVLGTGGSSLDLGAQRKHEGQFATTLLSAPGTGTGTLRRDLPSVRLRLKCISGTDTGVKWKTFSSPPFPYLPRIKIIFPELRSYPRTKISRVQTCRLQ